MGLAQASRKHCREKGLPVLAGKRGRLCCLQTQRCRARRGTGESSREEKHAVGNGIRMGALWATGQKRQDNRYSWAPVGTRTCQCRTELSGERRDQTQAFCESGHPKTVPRTADRMVFLQPNHSSLLACICTQVSLFVTELTAQTCWSLSCSGHSDQLSR